MIETPFPTKYILEVKVNSASWNIPTLGLCRNSVALNNNFKRQRVFSNTKICRKCNFQKILAELQMKLCFLGQSWTKYCNHFMKWRKIGVSMESFTTNFLLFSIKTLKFCILDGRLATRHQLKGFQNFLEVY